MSSGGVVIVILTFLCGVMCRNVDITPPFTYDNAYYLCSSEQWSMNGTADLDQALKTVGSNDYLLLKPGYHCVEEFNVVSNVTNVTIAGDGEGVFITCAPGLGLAFLNVTGLSIQRLTITGCGLNDSYLLEFYDRVTTSVDLFLKLTATTTIALGIASCTDVVMEGVTVSNTTGFGLVAVNVAGLSNFTNNTFSFNQGDSCFKMVPDISLLLETRPGGGAAFIYVDYANHSINDSVALDVSENKFEFNFYCGLELTLQTNYRYYETIQNRSYTIGSGGGLSLYLAQQTYPANVSIRSCSFTNNIATTGSAASVVWYEGLQDSHVTISDCFFGENGFFGAMGSLLFDKDISVPSRQIFTTRPNSLTISRSSFKRNTAYAGGGVYVESLSSADSLDVDLIIFEDCLFEGNTGASGAAIYAIETKFHAVQTNLSIQIENCTFVANIIDRRGTNLFLSTNAVVQATSIAIDLRESTFRSNLGTALSGSRSIFNLDGGVEFNNNSAFIGGAMRLVAATVVVVRNNSVIQFINNKALTSGGAIYANYKYGAEDAYGYDCFLYFQTVNLFCSSSLPCPDYTKLNISIVFRNNKAPLGGTLYGSTLDTCPWATILKGYLNLDQGNTILLALYSRPVLFHLDRKPISSVVLSTSVQNLEVSNSSILSYMPGQVFNLTLRGTDALNQSIPTLVTTLLEEQFAPQLGDSGYWLTSTTDFSTPTKVYGQRNVTMNITVYSLDTYVQSMPLGLNLTDCAFGFEYNAEKGDCQCSKAIMEAGVTCDPDLKVFSVPYGYWLGPGPNETGVEMSVIFRSCLLDYCKPFNGNTTVIVHPLALDDQCADYRTGLLCGRCKDGYSAVFGSNRCMKCSNNYLSLLIAFAAAGVGIIVVISFLHITVSDGYLNSVLFYASITSSYDVYFRGQSGSSSSIFFAIYWLNLNLGFDTCFYDGMMPLDRVGLKFVFPTYLFILMVAFIWMAGRSHKLSDFLARSRFSPSKLLATLITLSYNSITQSSFETLSYLSDVEVYRNDSVKQLQNRWYIDPNVEYVSDVKHAALFVVSLIYLIFFVIPIPAFLILPTFTSRGLSGRLKPLYDAFVSPFKDKFAFWIGLRLYLRIIYYSISSFTGYPLNVLLLGAGLLIVVFIHAFAQPYKSSALNGIDIFFHCNLLMLSMGTLYFQAIGLTSKNDNSDQMAFLFTLVCSAYLIMTYVLFWHIRQRLPWLSVPLHACFKKLRHRFRRSNNNARFSKRQVMHPDVLKEDRADGSPLKAMITTGNGKLEIPPLQPFSELREPLLDEPSEFVTL